VADNETTHTVYMERDACMHVEAIIISIIIIIIVDDKDADWIPVLISCSRRQLPCHHVAVSIPPIAPMHLHPAQLEKLSATVSVKSDCLERETVSHSCQHGDRKQPSTRRRDALRISIHQQNIIAGIH
jgi:hypothetical protein